MKILNHRQIEQKIKRMAYEIYERNFEESEIILIGVNYRGMEIAQRLLHHLLHIAENVMITVSRIQLSPANPLAEAIHLEMPVEELNGKSVIFVDDVANTGRTLFYAMQPIFEVLPKKVEAAVLVDRMHKSFPVRADYIGHVLATTLGENIFVDIISENEEAAYLTSATSPK